MNDVNDIIFGALGFVGMVLCGVVIWFLFQIADCMCK